MESMTGFGSFSSENGTSGTWTLRSVNGKGLESAADAPPVMKIWNRKSANVYVLFLPAAAYPYLWTSRRTFKFRRRKLISLF